MTYLSAIKLAALSIVAAGVLHSILSARSPVFVPEDDDRNLKLADSSTPVDTMVNPQQLSHERINCCNPIDCFLDIYLY